MGISYSPQAGTAARGDRFERGPRVGSDLKLPAALAATQPPVNATGAVILFLHASCGPCLSLWESLTAEGGDLERDLPDLTRILVTDDHGESIFSGPPFNEVFVQHANEISREMNVGATPYGIAVDSSGVVRWSGIPHTTDDVLGMAANICAAEAVATMEVGA